MTAQAIEAHNENYRATWLQVQVAIGSPFQENHLTLPADVLRINSRAGTLVVQLPHTEAEPGAKSPVTWCAP